MFLKGKNKPLTKANKLIAKIDKLSDRQVELKKEFNRNKIELLKLCSEFKSNYVEAYEVVSLVEDKAKEIKKEGV